MEIVKNNLENCLSALWTYCGKNPETYAENSELWEWETQLYNLKNINKATQDAIKTLKESGYSKKLINLIIEAIAIDYINEVVIRQCEEALSLEELEHIYIAAVKSIQSKARSQVAELIGRVNDNAGEKYLLQLIDDENEFVQRKALSSLSIINPEYFDEWVIKKLETADESLKLTILGLLQKISSTSLDQAIEILCKNPTTDIATEIYWIMDERGCKCLKFLDIGIRCRK